MMIGDVVMQLGTQPNRGRRGVRLGSGELVPWNLEIFGGGVGEGAIR